MSSQQADRDTEKRPVHGLWRALPLAALVIGAAVFFGLGFHRYLSFEELSRHREALFDWRDRNQALSVLAFMGVYVVLTALSIPGAIWMTIGGGFLFGLFWGTAYSVISATLGAVCVFLAARLLAGDWLRRRAGAKMDKLAAGLRRNGLSYLLVLRLMPIFPFWLVNLVPALAGIPLSTFVIGTSLGVIPGSIVYASVGNGLGAVIAAGEAPDLGVLFRPDVLGPLLGLASLALLPVAYRQLLRRRGEERDEDAG